MPTPVLVCVMPLLEINYKQTQQKCNKTWRDPDKTGTVPKVLVQHITIINKHGEASRKVDQSCNE
eukprot:606208-Amphidinium_carterae.1